MQARRLSMSGFVLGFFLLGAAAIPQGANAQISSEYTEIQNQGIIFANICTGDYTTACDCRDKGKCSVRDILQVIVNISYLVFALAGSAALIALVFGGFEWITSAGNHDRIDRGRRSIAGAAIGLFIIFGSYALINLVLSVLKTGDPATSNIEGTIGDGANTIIKSQ